MLTVCIPDTRGFVRIGVSWEWGRSAEVVRLHRRGMKSMGGGLFCMKALLRGVEVLRNLVRGWVRVHWVVRGQGKLLVGGVQEHVSSPVFNIEELSWKCLLLWSLTSWTPSVMAMMRAIVSHHGISICKQSNGHLLVCRLTHCEYQAKQWSSPVDPAAKWAGWKPVDASAAACCADPLPAVTGWPNISFTNCWNTVSSGAKSVTPAASTDVTPSSCQIMRLTADQQGFDREQIWEPDLTDFSVLAVSCTDLTSSQR